MASRLENRLRTITYQFLKTYPEAEALPATVRVRIVQKIFDRMINSGAVFDDPTTFKTAALGVDLEWDVQGTGITMRRDNVEVTDTLTDEVVESVSEPENAAYVDGSPWELLGNGEDEFLEFLVA